MYNQFFSKGLFRERSEIIIDVMGDTAVYAKTNIMQYIIHKLLKNHITVEKRENKLYYNGEQLLIFFNESLLPQEFIKINLEEVAIIKLLGLYYTTEIDSSYNAIAIYPKRYPFTNVGIAQNIFQIKGTDTQTVLLR